MKRCVLLIVSIAIHTFTFAQSIPPYIPSSGLKSLYLFSANPADSSGYGANGTVYGSVSYGTDRFGHANSCYLGDDSSGVKIPNTHLPVGNSSRSVSAWYKSVLPYAGGNREMVAWGDNIALGRRFALFTNDSLLGLEYLNGSVTVNFTHDSLWHNIIVTYPVSGSGSSSISLYLDGVLQVTTTYTPVSYFATDTGSIHTIGTLFLPPYPYYSWVGGLDDIAIWDRALTSCEAWKIAHDDTIATAGSISGPDSICSAGSITLSDSMAGGTWSVTNGDATISGSGIVTGVSSGVDTVLYTVISACGTATAAKYILVNPGIAVSSISGTDTVCFPIEMATVYSDSTPGGIWNSTNAHAIISTSGMLTSLSAGADTILYTVTGPCGTTTISKFIYILPAPAVSPLAGPAYVCMGDTITLSDTLPGGTWGHVYPYTTVSTSGQVIGISPGTDTIKYTVSNFCGISSASKTVIVYTHLECDSVLSVEQPLNEYGLLTIYPNPSSRYVTICSGGNDPIGSLQLINELGQVILDKTITGIKEDLDLSIFTNGLYFVRIGNNNGFVYRKILKQ